MRTRIKICGITSVDQALMVEDLAVDAIGIVFYAASDRAIDMDEAIRIRQAIGSFTTLVGLFVDEEIEVVNDVADMVGLDTVQLHGMETPDYCQYIDRPVIKALEARENYLERSVMYNDCANSVLIDTPSDKQFGGSGTSFDWNILPQILPKHMIIAGGLSIDNIDSILAKNPYAIDVSSSIESQPGIKDKIKTKQLIERIQQYG